jgi:hypothetical protein
MMPALMNIPTRTAFRLCPLVITSGPLKSKELANAPARRLAPTSSALGVEARHHGDRANHTEIHNVVARAAGNSHHAYTNFTTFPLQFSSMIRGRPYPDTHAV